jgi:hypothetical protein
MQRATKSRVILVALCLMLVFAGIFWLQVAKQAATGPGKGRDVQAAAQAMKKIRKQLKSVISSPEDPLARFNFEYRRLRDPRTGKIPVNIREKELIFSATIPVAEALIFSTTAPAARGQVLGWDNRGPYNIGGRTRALALDSRNENILVAGGVSGGMWRSTNGGGTWVKTTDPTLLQSVTTVVQDKRTGKGNTWYYGTGELIGNSASAVMALYRGNGIYKSLDNGASWQPLPATVSNASNITEITNVFQWVWRVAVNPANAGQDEVLAATIGGIQRSVDGGTTWKKVLGTDNVADLNSHTRYTDIAISASGVMYATLSQANNNSQGGTALVRGIYRSVNGLDWVNITPSGWPQVFERVVLDIAAANENVVYFLANTPESGKFNAQLWQYTYRSGTGGGAGGTWENRTANLPGFGGSVGDYNHQGNYNMLLAVKPDNPQHVFIGGTNLYRSTDGFASAANTRWIGGYSLDNTAGMYPQHHPDQHALIFYPSNANRSVSAHDGGLSRTENLLATDTVRWTNLNRGYLTTQFTSVAIDPDMADDFILGGMQDNGSWATESESPTATWYSLLTGDGAFGAAVGNSLFVAAQNGFIIRYAFDRQGEFKGYARVDPKGGGGYLFVNPYVIDPNNQYVMYLPAGDTLWRNNNIDAIPVGQGDSFTELKTTNWKVISTLSGQAVSAIAISKSPANIVYLGTSTGQMYKLTNTLSSDSPARTALTSSLFPQQAYVSSIAVNPANGNNVVVTFSNYGVISLFQSTNGGSAWTAIAGNLEQNPDGSGNGPAVKWVSILPAKAGNPVKYFVGTSTGLYATSTVNGAATVWIKEGSTTIGNMPVDMVVSRSTDNLVVAGTHGNGVYSHVYNEPLAVVAQAGRPTSFALIQNFPNPVRTSTTITYQLAQAGQVRLQVFDLSGREVASLVDARQAAGTHKVLWQGQSNSGRRLANGLYLYQLQVANQRAAKQMLLLR